MRFLPLPSGIGAIGLAGMIAMSCTSLRENPVFGTASKPAEVPQHFVEAYIEFPGPTERWSGPGSWIVHAKASDPPEISVSLATSGRNSAHLAANAHQGGPSVKKILDQINSLAVWTEASAVAPLGAPAPVAEAFPFRNCLSPIRVRLIRSDGLISERRGCRAQSPWSAVVSSMASDLASYASGAGPALKPPEAPELASPPVLRVPAAVVVTAPAAEPTVLRAPAAVAPAAVAPVIAAPAAIAPVLH